MVNGVKTTNAQMMLNISIILIIEIIAPFSKNLNNFTNVEKEDMDNTKKIKNSFRK